MYLSSLQIINFRNLKNVEFRFQAGTNTIIGENSSGKSNAMEALRILLDSGYPYSKKLRESDFYNGFEKSRGNWIIISAKFSGFNEQDRLDEACANLLNETGNPQDEGIFTLFIRPNKKIRNQLYLAQNDENEYRKILNSLSLFDYEFVYKARSCHRFTEKSIYDQLLSMAPDDELKPLLGDEVNSFSVKEKFSIVYVNALRDADSELKKYNNPLRNIFDVIRDKLSKEEVNEIQLSISNLNNGLLNNSQIKEIASHLNNKLSEIVGTIYGSNVNICSQLKNDIQYLGRFLSISTHPNSWSLDSMGLGELNVLFIGLKLLEYEYLNKKSALNIMILEEPEAHVHVHIQRELFTNIPEKEDYTQVIMTTHSTHLSEISKINRMNVMKIVGNYSEVMTPVNNLEHFAKKLNLPSGLDLSECIQRYLDAKRSILLFSKSVLLVEGDAEEILIPALVKKIYGVSLDELGIGIINIGSVSFEYIACLFDKTRINRRCAIITDGDYSEKNGIDDEKTEKNNLRAAERLEKLKGLFDTNPCVDIFHCQKTFEVELGKILCGTEALKRLLGSLYQRETDQKNVLEKIRHNPEEYLQLAKNKRKGWLAVILANFLTPDLNMPAYIEDALCHVVDNLPFNVWKKICSYVAKQNKNIELINRLNNVFSIEDKDFDSIYQEPSLPKLCQKILPF